MSTTIRGFSAPPDSAPDATTNIWQRFVAFLVRRRIRITVIVFVLLVAEDVLEGVRPHDLLNFHDLKTVVGLGLVAAGLAIRSWAAGILHKHTKLTTSGPYALIRHPLYIGSFLMMIGFCTLIDDAENIWFVLGPLAMLYTLHVRKEEHKLVKKFSAQWHDYAQSVPRFLPRWLPTSGPAKWKLRQWAKNREYQALSAAMLGLMAIEAWRLH